MIVTYLKLIRCDGWYHPPCVGMPEDEIEIVDQFICPPCVTGHYLLNHV